VEGHGRDLEHIAHDYGGFATQGAISNVRASGEQQPLTRAIHADESFNGGVRMTTEKRVFCSAVTLTLILLLMGAPVHGTAAPIVLNFDTLTAMNSFPPGPAIPLDAQLSDAFLTTFGVRFSSGSPYVPVVFVDGVTTSTPNGIGGSSPAGNLTYERAFPVVARFFDPSNSSRPATTDFVSLRGDLSGQGEAVTLNGFDVNNRLIASMTTIDSGGETLTLSKPGIHSVQFLGTHDGDGVVVDDFTFNTVTPAIPEPSHALFLAAGLAALVGFSVGVRFAHGSNSLAVKFL
jgi:hypothetical protein